jgi:hypothetical protein
LGELLFRRENGAKLIAGEYVAEIFLVEFLPIRVPIEYLAYSFLPLISFLKRREETQILR